jgi:hypothetical protein
LDVDWTKNANRPVVEHDVTEISAADLVGSLEIRGMRVSALRVESLPVGAV